MIAQLVRLSALVCCVVALRAAVVVPPGIDHDPWTALLERYVDERGLVDYAGLAAAPDDRAALDAYLAQFARVPEVPATGAERHAALINAYNAFTIRRVIQLEVPADGSFWSHDPFDREIHPVGGAAVSLDAIEHRALRPEMDYRIHAALVCAAVSCPPLRRTAYTAEGLDAALDEQLALWLARDDLNRFDRAAGVVRISKIFDWFAEDFEQAGGIPVVLGRHGPPELRAWLATGSYRVRHLPYDKTLNAQQ